MQERLSQSAALDQSYIALSVSSADTEHSFSKYRTVFFTSSSKHVDRQFVCSLLSILQQHCAAKTTSVTVVLSVDC